jgi:Xaa-Pro dipeptidase
MPSSKLISPTRRSFLAAAAIAAPALTLHAQMAEESAGNGKLPVAIAALKPRVQEAVPITLAEREGRLEKARSLMKAKGIDALIITVGTSLNYFSGLKVGYQSERLFAWILPSSGAPFVVCPAFEEGRIREGLTMAPDGAATKIHTWNEDESPYDLVAKSLRDRGLATGTVGVEERTQFAFADGLMHVTPALNVVNGTVISAGCRMIKSPAELALMQLANNITLSVYEAAYKSAKPGMTNQEFTGLIDAGYERSGVRGEASCQVGVYSALPHGSVQPQVIREGEIILIDDGCFVEGYQSDMSRSFVLGKPTDKQKKVFSIVHAAQAAALAAARPGIACSAIDKAARDVIDAAGFGPDYKHFTHRVGHGIGMDMHEWPYLVRGNSTKLEPGKMFTPTSPIIEDPFGKG